MVATLVASLVEEGALAPVSKPGEREGFRGFVTVASATSSTSGWVETAKMESMRIAVFLGSSLGPTDHQRATAELGRAIARRGTASCTAARTSA